MKNKIICFILISLSLCSVLFIRSFLIIDETHAMLSSLTLRQKIGQLFIVATTTDTSNPRSCYRMDTEYITYLIKEYHIGGLVFLYKNEVPAMVDAINFYQQISKIPLLIALDAETGIHQRIKNVIQFPSASTLGTIDDDTILYNLGYEIGLQCKALGVHINFAPVVDILYPELTASFLKPRLFSSDPKKVASCAYNIMKGMQDAGIITCAKHFPGHGPTPKDSHKDLPIILQDYQHILHYDCYPFLHLIQNNVDLIMTAHVMVKSLDSENPASLSPIVINTLLRTILKFEGICITDALGMRALTTYYSPGTIELKALLAGNDILLCPLDVPLAVEIIEKAIQENRLSQQELDNHVLKILQLKQKYCHTIKPIKSSETQKFLFRPSVYQLKNVLEEKSTIL